MVKIMKNHTSAVSTVTTASGKKKIREPYKLFLYILPCLVFIFIFKYLPLWGWSFAFFQYKPGMSLANCGAGEFQTAVWQSCYA
jgi:putative aldouronate transport system permease protein